MSNELRRQRERTIYAVSSRQKALLSRSDELKARWRAVAPQLIEVVSKALPRSVIKVSFGGGVYTITGIPDGGYIISMDNNMFLKIVNGQIQYLEKDPSFTKIIFGEGVCEPMSVVERGSLMFPYLVANWKTVGPLFETAIRTNLLFWETLQD